MSAEQLAQMGRNALALVERDSDVELAVKAYLEALGQLTADARV